MSEPNDNPGTMPLAETDVSASQEPEDTDSENLTDESQTSDPSSTTTLEEPIMTVATVAPALGD